jgi:hypothetical protein
MALRFLDTNILLYSIGRNPTEGAKPDRAIALIDAGDGGRTIAARLSRRPRPLLAKSSVHRIPSPQIVATNPGRARRN